MPFQLQQHKVRKEKEMNAGEMTKGMTWPPEGPKKEGEGARQRQTGGVGWGGWEHEENRGDLRVLCKR